jgi:ribonuclease HII
MPREKITDLPEKPDLKFETELWGKGFGVLAGLDEVGRGALAGPVYAGAVVLPNHDRICDDLEGVRDSKVMTPAERDKWVECIKSCAAAWGVGSATEIEIDQFGIVEASCMAMRRALEALPFQPDHLLVDYITVSNCTIPQLSMPKGDALSLSIAAASIVAKTARDAFMIALSPQYPGYGFETNVGYGTPEHQKALKKLGVLPIHRKTYEPVRLIIERICE